MGCAYNREDVAPTTAPRATASRRLTIRQLRRTKNLDALLADRESAQHQLRRTLGAFDVVMLGIGAIVGAGIFATIGTAAAGDMTRPGAGPALMLSFVVTGVACGFAALCYAEFAAMVPIAGQRLHLRLRHARRAGRLDHRLGPDHRVRGRQRRGGDQLGQLLQDAGVRVRHRHPRLAVHRLSDRRAHPGALRTRAAHRRRPDRVQHPRHLASSRSSRSCWSSASARAPRSTPGW